VTPEDVERFYKSDIEKFTDPATAQVRIAKASSEDAAKAISDFPTSRWREGGRPHSRCPETVDTKLVFDTEVGKTTAPVQAGNDWYVFHIESKTAEKVKPFDEVKEQASTMFKMQKEQEQVNGLIDQTLKEREVKLYPDRLKPKTT